ncbi:hypothetical protein KV557_00165 [Kitasatospora aureofaciens]|uniref:hypothetical protein n=1 Tax=Kitasatospora aureofaciens TaxID=1894 RepID=UPI001C491B14|nr:hypothetical protein [Kitasatospora aureofaciens]MBV6695540.1 hypothetical protein [Kitasatospora aureofaciens]
MPPRTITFAVDPALDSVAALAVDHSSRQYLEQAGFVRDDATGLHRLRRDTPASVGQRISAEAARLLTASGYTVLRLYSEDEQQQALAASPEQGPALTREPGTIWMHHIASDVAAGHLVIHARLSVASGETKLLASYPMTGSAAIFSTEGGGYFGLTEYEDLETATADFGHPLEPSIPSSPSRRAAASSRTAPLSAPSRVVATDRVDHSPATAGASHAR